MMKSGFRVRAKMVVLAGLILMMAAVAFGQSGATRPRRVTTPPTTDNDPNPSSSPMTTTPATNTTRTTTARPAAASTGSGASVARAYSLLEQKQYDAAAKEAKQVTASDPNNSEAWKIAGFAEVNLKQYAEAAADLQRALDLQRAAGSEDANTVDALARAYIRTEDYTRALPLLVVATTRTPATPDALMLYYRGLAEYRTNKATDAERSFNAAIKADPKNSAALFYLGRIAFERKDDNAAITALNRATLSDSRFADAWTILTYAYMRRAAAATGAKADADNLSAVRASEGLMRARSDETSTALHGQALIGAGQYARAATALERVAAGDSAQATTLYLLGFAHSRANNFPKAINALERAAAKTPDDVNIYRELGYVYEANKQYAKALATYERGLQLAPGDAYFTESAERVRPFAK